jgi:hypothetical protein
MENTYTVTLTQKQLEVLQSLAFAEQRKADDCKSALPSQRKFAHKLVDALLRTQIVANPAA